jgi:hypothetical protein
MNDLLFRHPCRWLAGIHRKNFKTGCPINNVGHDGGEVRGDIRYRDVWKDGVGKEFQL